MKPGDVADKLIAQAAAGHLDWRAQRDAIADAIRTAVEAEKEAWRTLAEGLIDAGGEDGRYVAISEQRAWADAVAAVRERG